MHKSLLGILCVTTVLGSASAARSETVFADDFESGDTSAWNATVPEPWALWETFDGDPPSPSQELLPDTFDFVVTHRTHARNHEPFFPPFPADHGDDCAGPDPSVPGGPAQHEVTTSHTTSGSEPDPSFFICKNHMMSSMGEVEGYSVTSFWPRQEFDFSDGGVLEFDVNINDDHKRSWWEILITPSDQLKMGAAIDWLPIDETYPIDRIVLVFSEESKRSILVGSGALSPDGWTTEARDWRTWDFIDPDDPALDDRRIRRTMRVELEADRIDWSVETVDGSFDTYSADLPEGLPFTRGLVVFKTHAYTPKKDHNYDVYTFHWDEIRFDGPVVGRYDAYETSEIAYLEANGHRPLGDSTSLEIDLPRVGTAPVLTGQVHGALFEQVLLSVNGGPTRTVHPFEYGDDDGCGMWGWGSFRVPLDASELVVGTNTFEWTVGPRPACAGEVWDGFSVKSLEVQLAAEAP